MNKVLIPIDCDCLKKSEINTQQLFENNDLAFEAALKLKDKMSYEFCSKHSFQVLKIFDDYAITFANPLEKSLRCCGSGCCD